MHVTVGTYANSGGAGVVPLVIDGDRLHPGEPEPSLRNASFAAEGRGLHYLVDEQGKGALVAARWSDDGWQRLGSIATGGGDPCYVALDRAGYAAAVANYASGSLTLVTLDPATGLPLQADIRQHHGSGPNRERQEGPHVHCTLFSPDGQTLYAVDLGTDTVTAYAYDCTTLGEPRIAWSAPPGAGPRHLLFHPSEPRAWLLCELASELWLFDVDEDGALHPRRHVSTLQVPLEGNLGGHLAIRGDGTRVYVTNRGHNSVAVFAGDDLRPLQTIASTGVSPRHLLLMEAERRALVVHEQDGVVALFALGDDGLLAGPVARVTIPGAAFAFTAGQGSLHPSR